MFKVLLVAETEVALDRAKACLEKRNLQVATASSVQALELADTLQPDLPRPGRGALGYLSDRRRVGTGCCSERVG